LKNRKPRKLGKPQRHQGVPGKKQQNTHLPQALIDTVHAIWLIRKDEDSGVKLSSIYRELLEEGIKSIDLETGHRKPTLSVPGQSGPGILAALALFDELVDCHRLDDADLIRAMDKSWMMLWAAGPDNENIHANPILEKYTGRSAIEFRQLNWMEVIYPEDRERIFKVVTEGFRTLQPFRFSYRMRRWDGLYGGIIDHAHPRFLPDRRFAGYIGTAYEVAAPGMTVEVLLYDRLRWTFQERLIVPAGPTAVRR
jgi:PAS domain-containing protein